MTNTHRLDKNLHSEFLQQGRIDPITGEKIEEGHTIVICSACKSAFFIESWEYLVQNHCNQSETLSEIPKPKSLFLQAKPLEYLPFLFKKGSYEVDTTYKSLLENLFIILAFMAGSCFIFFIALIVGSYSTPILGVLSGFGVIGIFAALMHKRKASSLINKKINAKKASYVALNAKKQAITIKKKKVEQLISFDQIQQISYTFKNIRSDTSNSYHNYSLSLEIISKENKKANYYAILHQDEIPKWSAFLEELPYNLKVMNVR